MVGGVDTPGAGVDLLWQAIGVRALELAQGAVLHQHLGQREVHVGQFRQHRFGGGSLALGGLVEHRHTELVVEDHAQLLGRTEVELLAGDLEGLAFQLGHFLAQLDTLHAQQLGIDQRALAFDLGQYRYQRHLDVGQHRLQAWNLRKLLLQGLVQTQGDVRVFRGIGAGLFQGDLVEGQLLGTFAGDVGKADGSVVQVLERQAVHVMTGGGGVEHVGLEHGVVGHALHLDTVGNVATDGAVGEDVHVVLGVLRHLDLGRVLQQRLERQQHAVAVELLGHAHVGMGQRHISAFMGLDRERHADQLRLLGIEPGGFGVESEQWRLAQLL
ncbi:hypothetical protein D3C80_987080 [compost metagenome]